MSDEHQVIIKVVGDPIRLVLPGDGWTFGEALLAKELSGLTPVEIEERLLFASDPEAWLAVLQVSYKRAGREFPAAEIDDFNMADLAQAVTEAMNKVAKRPPTKRRTRAKRAARA